MGVCIYFFDLHLFVPHPLSPQLNLSGLLNVLDGVVDSPERILVMTTNHPEKLDPAVRVLPPLICTTRFLAVHPPLTVPFHSSFARDE